MNKSFSSHSLGLHRSAFSLWIVCISQMHPMDHFISLNQETKSYNNHGVRNTNPRLCCFYHEFPSDWLKHACIRMWRLRMCYGSCVDLFGIREWPLGRDLQQAAVTWWCCELSNSFINLEWGSRVEFYSDLSWLMARADDDRRTVEELAADRSLLVRPLCPYLIWFRIESNKSFHRISHLISKTAGSTSIL